MYRFAWTKKAKATFLQLEADAGGKKSSRQAGRFKQVVKALKFLRNDPRHPSLHTHPFSGIDHPFSKAEKVFEAYAQNRTPGAYRIFWCYRPENDQITIIAITPHP